MSLYISDSDFESVVDEAIKHIPQPYQQKLDNIAFLIEDEPSQEQRSKLRLDPYTTLFGLYEGVPLPQRGGTAKLLPDKITIFKRPLLAASSNVSDLRRNVGHAVWHEVAHYFGLDHERIHELDSKI